MNLLQYFIDKYQGKICMIDKEIFLHLDYFDDDDSFHNSFNLTKIYLDYQKNGDKVIINDRKYFQDLPNKHKIYLSENVNELEKTIVNLKK